MTNPVSACVEGHYCKCSSQSFGNWYKSCKSPYQERYANGRMYCLTEVVPVV